MVRVVGIRFKKAGKIYYFNPGEIPLNIGDKVIVETARGLEYGEVVIGPKEVPEESLVSPLKDVIRKATLEDDRIFEENREKAREAEIIAEKKIQEHGLIMKLVDIEYTFDRSKLIFYFTADGRVDFRELVKDLAAIFKTRIELRQIGVRDEAKMVGGLGPCGRVICCHTFLGEFDPVSIKMAKQQNLSLNPGKISGLCGRLMCCLKYECVNYQQEGIEENSFEKEKFELGNEVLTPLGEGIIMSINEQKGIIEVELKDTKEIKEFPKEEIVKNDVEIGE